MAYVPPPDDPNAQGQGQGQQAPGGGAPPVTTSAAPSGNGQGVTSVPGSATQPPVQNLQDYLAANQDQAVAMGKTIGDNLTAGANKVTGDIGADLSAVDNQVQASNVNPNAGLVNSAASDPTKFVTDPSNLAAFLQQENAKYTGPNAAEGTPEWAALTKEISDANAKMPDLSNPGAYLQLASGQETNPTTGMTNLDAALLQETPGASAPISAAAPAYAALQGQQSTAASAEDAAIAKAQANDVAASGLIAPAFLTGTNAEVPKWEAALKAELDNAQKGTDTYNTETNDQIAAMNSLFPIINGYESSNPNFTNLAAPPSLQQPSSASPTMASVATAQDYATENALQELLGSKFSTPPITQGTVGEAGSYSVPQFNPFDAQGYLNPLVETRYKMSEN